MVIADCEVCAPLNDAPENQVHARICPHATSDEVLRKDRAAVSSWSTVEAVGLHTSTASNYDVEPCHLYVLENSTSEQAQKLSEIPYLKFFEEETAVGNISLTCLRMTQSGMLEEARRYGRPLSSPDTPSMEKLETRMATLACTTSLLEPLQNLQFAKCGFFKADDNNVKCFQCGISFRIENVHDSSWDIRIEHSRWSPFCGFIRQENGTEARLLHNATGQVHSEQDRNNSKGYAVLRGKMEEKRMFL